MIFLIYFFLAYGLTNLLVYGTGPFDILSNFRTFAQEKMPVIGKMLECMMCTSTNIGFILSIINLLFISEPITPFNKLLNQETEWFFIILFDGFVTSGIVWLIHTIQEHYERN